MATNSETESETNAELDVLTLMREELPQSVVRRGKLNSQFIVTACIDFHEKFQISESPPMDYTL